MMGIFLGMIRQNVQEWARREGLETAYQFWKKTELNRDTAYKLWNEEDYIPREKVMLRLYEVFKWQPGQYLYAVPSEDNEEE
jgi:hypothetical protein